MEIKKANAYHAQLHALDSPTQTYGCRHTNPDFCAKNRLRKVCAFMRDDKICCSPPFGWVKQFKKLQAENGSGAQLTPDVPPAPANLAERSQSLGQDSLSRGATVRAHPAIKRLAKRN
jgi:hypothetical protein